VHRCELLAARTAVARAQPLAHERAERRERQARIRDDRERDRLEVAEILGPLALAQLGEADVDDRRARREQRIPGYPQLTDFVQRRLKHSIRYMERMHIHYSTVGQRITELLDRVRAQLNSLQTEKMVEDIHEQVTLTQIAEIVVLAGGTYYIFSLLKPIIKVVSEVPEVFLVGLAFGLVCLLHPRYRRIVWRKRAPRPPL